jgi:hypothetical protein
LTKGGPVRVLRSCPLTVPAGKSTQLTLRVNAKARQELLKDCPLLSRHIMIHELSAGGSETDGKEKTPLLLRRQKDCSLDRPHQRATLQSGPHPSRDTKVNKQRSKQANTQASNTWRRQRKCKEKGEGSDAIEGDLFSESLGVIVSLHSDLAELSRRTGTVG